MAVFRIQSFLSPCPIFRILTLLDGFVSNTLWLSFLLSGSRRAAKPQSLFLNSYNHGNISSENRFPGPNRSENPFAFLFKKQKIAGYSGKQLLIIPYQSKFFYYYICMQKQNPTSFEKLSGFILYSIIY